MYCDSNNCWKDSVCCLYACPLCDKVKCKTYADNFYLLQETPIEEKYLTKYGPPEFVVPNAIKEKEKREKQAARRAIEKEKEDKKREKERKKQEKVKAAEAKRKKRIKARKAKDKAKVEKVAKKPKEAKVEHSTLETKVKRKRRTKKEMALAGGGK